MKMKKLMSEADDTAKLFYLYLIFTLGKTISYLWEYALIQKILSHEGNFESAVTGLTVFQSILSILQALTVLFIIFYFLRWFYHSHLMLEQDENIYYLNHKSNSAIWSWFVPVINLILPYLVMRENYETWKELKNPRSKKPDNIVFFWWILFISSIVAGAFGIGVLEGINSPNLEKYINNPWPFFLPGLIEMVAISATLKMLKNFKKFYVGEVCA
ncbi:MAG: DUF4328 domain-containing protein [Bacteroidota bacterium]